MNKEIEKQIDTLLHGGKMEARQAKEALKKVLDRKFRPYSRTKEQTKKDRKIFLKEVLSIYQSLFDCYATIQNHNKSSVLSFLSHALFYFEDNHEYFEIFLGYVREALKDETDGNLRQIAVTTSSNTYAISTIGLWRSSDIQVSAKRKRIFEKYQEIVLRHVITLFDSLEASIEKDENNFPEAVEYMKSSVVKSHLLYIFDFDRFDVLPYISGMYEEPSPYEDHEHCKRWKHYYQTLLNQHPHIQKFITLVPRFDLHKYEAYEYATSDIPKMVQNIINRPEEKGILSSEFFFGGNAQDQELAPGGFAVPEDSYFEIWDLVQDVDNQDDLFEIFNIVYLQAWQAPVSEMYWYDLADFILSKYNDIPLRLKILEEALKKLSVKVVIHLPIHSNGKNNISYGIHEHRPIFRILVAYAMYHHEYGDTKIAVEYYHFLLKLNSYDNQGVRYLFAALHAGKPASYVDKLFEVGNRTQNWDEVENFLSEQNAKHHFWNEPK